MEVRLNEGERLDAVNDKISLIQIKEGLTFGTDALLLAGYAKGGFKLSAELGGGTGIISLLLLSRGKTETVHCFEVQKDFFDLISRNAALNSLRERLIPILSDVRDIKGAGEYDLVFTNPPYMTVSGGAKNVSDRKNIARHEVFGTVCDFLTSAGKMLKFGGSLLAVYRPDRLSDLFSALREAGIEAKRLTIVHANGKSEPSMVLLEGKKGGKVGLKVTRPLFIYRDEENKSYSSDMEYIMEKGSFPSDFYIK